MGTPPKVRRWIQWVLGAAGILMGVAAAALTFGHRAPAPVPPQPRSTAPTALYVQHDGGALRLHWDPAVQANSGARCRLQLEGGPAGTIRASADAEAAPVHAAAINKPAAKRSAVKPVKVAA